MEVITLPSPICTAVAAASAVCAAVPGASAIVTSLARASTTTPIVGLQSAIDTEEEL
jgi:hypothetical protein